ncbi:hypothetical protein C882_1175 [Caenispirillum salinarum AK4]|uniref:Uncharacterized protein n=1 Tax=Caenispirillum salinarum AK4 TaxID=1238182 RepID=K9GTX3_9PROT|nr:hypothetical protein [Caenispirillum salinarum]EKV28174.1 hypothetical protein C882_1175 [Caenispirillum salinarum AK4]
MTAAPVHHRRPSQASDDAAAERHIVEGLCYLEREADRAALKDLATTIRAALDIYTHTRGQECDA